MLDNYTAMSIWFHSVMIGGLIPNAFSRVVANRAADSSGQFISDWDGFVRFVTGVLLAVVFIQPGIEWIVTTYFVAATQNVSNSSGPTTLVNLISFGIELFVYRRLVLGR